MKIFGIRTDIVQINRLKKVLKKKSSLSRLFSTHEISRCQKTNKSFNCFAKRFAAKEAFSKALGTGISKGIHFNQIVVLNEKNGKPLRYLFLATRLKKIVIYVPIQPESYGASMDCKMHGFQF